jgi:general secretion pathway protein J
MNKLSTQRAFTLVEILIALVIFSILAVIVAIGLHSSLTTYQKVKTKAECFSQLQVALTVMERDVMQAVPRSIVGYDDLMVPALHGRKNGFGVTRGGFINPNAVETRSTLQRITYKYQNHQLIRLTWPVLDQVKDSKPAERILLAGVDQLSFQYIDEHNALRSFWPVIASQLTSLPRGVEVTMQVQGLGSVSRIFMVPGGVSLAKN